jgi:hypothetical protein
VVTVNYSGEKDVASVEFDFKNGIYLSFMREM